MKFDVDFSLVIYQSTKMQRDIPDQWLPVRQFDARVMYCSRSVENHY